jgi:hypothetical protein
MAGYIGSGRSVVSPGAEKRVRFVATEGQTVFSSLSFSPGFVHVFHNGIRLVEQTDFTTTGGNAITLENPATEGDEIVVISYATFNIADAFTKSEANEKFVNIESGTEFPATPNLGDEVWRTDLDAFFKWTGDVWVEIG